MKTQLPKKTRTWAFTPLERNGQYEISKYLYWCKFIYYSKKNRPVVSWAAKRVAYMNAYNA